MAVYLRQRGNSVCTDAYFHPAYTPFTATSCIVQCTCSVSGTKEPRIYKLFFYIHEWHVIIPMILANIWRVCWRSHTCNWVCGCQNLVILIRRGIPRTSVHF